MFSKLKYFSSGAAGQGHRLFRQISQNCSSPSGKSAGFIPNLHLTTTAFIIKGLIHDFSMTKNRQKNMMANL
jgi:hypothetical protein